MVKQALVEHIELTRKEKGCLIFNVIQDNENTHRFNVYEEFTNKNAFELHQQRVKKTKWGKLMTNIERHYQMRTLDRTLHESITRET